MRLISTLLVTGLCAGVLPAQQVPTGFVVDTLVASGIPTPNDFCFLPDGRILFANVAGSVSIWAGSTIATVGTVPNVETGSERGLLSVCADPGFAQNGFIYVWYSSTLDAFMHLDRFTCTGDLANATSTNLTFAAASRRVVLANAPDNAFNHNGGTARFGPDAMLYLSIGDDASACTAQTLSAMQGKILRMDVSQLGAGGSTTAPTASQLDPGNNPLSNNTDFTQLVIAYGLRNPFRMTIDGPTGNLYIGDVGQNAVEEYDQYTYVAGAPALVNFGWPWREGNQAYTTCGGSQPPGLVDPIAVVPQSGSAWRSAIGGPRYRNQGGQYDFGPSYEGNAFWSDYYAGEIRRLVNNAGVWSPAPAVPGQPSASAWATGFASLTSMQLGADGAIYVTQHPGSLKRIRLLGPVNSVVAVSGGGQRGPAGEPFPLPLVFEVRDPQGAPLAGGTVNFSVAGGGTLSTTNPVIANASGLAETSVTATNLGGAITVTASTPGSPLNAQLALFARRIAITPAASLIILQVTNSSPQTPVQVPYVVLASMAGIPPLPTPIGPICTDPNNPATFVLEDSIGLFGFASLSGTGAIGTPSLTKIYNIPSSALTGLTLSFQAVGIDPVLGVFRTNCETRAF
jgi:glucose/arabinose dehydrogenase